MRKKDLIRIALFLGQELPIPEDRHIEDTISKLQAALDNKKINKFCNASIKEGYTKAIEILRDKNIEFNQYSELKTLQSKSIAALAVDYLKGECAQEVLCSIPIK